MARYCSAQDNVRTRQSPPYRETIRVNVLHGRKSMSWAKSVLPLFTGTSSETFRKVPDRVQIDTTLIRQNRVQYHDLINRRRLLNRTAVMVNQFSYRTGLPMVDLFFSSFATMLEMQRAFASGGMMTAPVSAKFGRSDQSHHTHQSRHFEIG